MMEIQRNGAFTTEILDSFACAGVRGIQQVQRSSSTSCLGGLPKPQREQRGRTRSIVRQAKKYMTAPGFEAELLAAKLLGRRGAAGFKDCLPSTDPLPAMQAEIVTSKLPDTIAEATTQIPFRCKPSVGTWILPRTMVLARALHKQINEEVLAPYAPRLQAHNQLYLTSLGNVLSVNKIPEVSPYSPRLQRRSCLHLAFLEEALSGATTLDIAPYAPRLQARSHLYLESLESTLSVTKSEESAPYAPRHQERMHLLLAHLADAWSTLQTPAANLHFAHIRGEKKLDVAPFVPTLQTMASMPQSAFDAIHAAFPRAERKEEISTRQKVNHTTNMLSMPKSAFDAIYAAFPKAERKQHVDTKPKADGTTTMLSMPKSVAPPQRNFSACPTVIVHTPMLFGPMMYSCGFRPMPFFI